MDQLGALLALAVGLLAALDVANLLGKNGQAQTKTQPWIAIFVWGTVFFLVFFGLQRLGIISN